LTITKFTAEYVLKEILKSLYVWQSCGGKVGWLKLTVHWGTALLKDELLGGDLMYGRQAGIVVTASCYY